MLELVPNNHPNEPENWFRSDAYYALVFAPNSKVEIVHFYTKEVYDRRER